MTVLKSSLLFRYSLMFITGCIVFSCSQKIPSAPPADEKLVVFGLDAADWDFISPLVNQGKLPAFRYLMTHGAIANLSTLYPTLSPNIWTSYATGKSPKDHGIRCWVTESPKGLQNTKGLQSNKKVNPADVKELKLQKSASSAISQTRRVRAFWNIFTELSMPSLTIGWMMSDPLEKVNGVEVGFLLDENKMPAVYPPDCLPTVKEIHQSVSTVGLENVYSPEVMNALSHYPADKTKVVKKALFKDLLFQKTLMKLIPERQWKIAAVYSRLLDVTQHLFYRFTIPDGFERVTEYDEALGKLIPETYCLADSWLQELLNNIDESTSVVVLSDHGFTSIAGHPFLVDCDALFREFFNDDRVDHPPGDITFIDTKDISDKRTVRITAPPDLLVSDRDALVNKWLGFLTEKVRILPDDQPLFLKPDFLPPGKFLTINLILNPELDVTDTIQCEQFSRPVSSYLSQGKTTWFMGFNGIHLAKPQGIVAFLGPQSTRGRLTTPVHVYDILPTILAFFNIPVARDMPGSVRQDLFRQHLKTVTFIDSYESTPFQPQLAEEPKISVADNKDLMNELKALGYLQ